MLIKMKNKLNNNQGASLFLALLFLIMTVMVSTTIVAAAVTAVMSTSENKEFRQNALALESAALMVKNKMEGNPETAGDESDDPVYIVTTVTRDDDPAFLEETKVMKHAQELEGMLEAAIENYIELSLETGGPYTIRTIIPGSPENTVESTTTEIVVSYVLKYLEDKDTVNGDKFYRMTFTFGFADVAAAKDRIYLYSTICQHTETPITELKTKENTDGTGEAYTVTTETVNYTWTESTFVDPGE